MYACTLGGVYEGPFWFSRELCFCKAHWLRLWKVGRGCRILREVLAGDYGLGLTGGGREMIGVIARLQGEVYRILRVFCLGPLCQGFKRTLRELCGWV